MHFRSQHCVRARERAARNHASIWPRFVASLGTVGYATRRDLSSWYRVLFWALLALLLLVIFGGYTILDFNRLRRAGQESAVPIAASIFLDVTNIFLFLLQLFGGNRD